MKVLATNSSVPIAKNDNMILLLGCSNILKQDQ